MRTSIDAVVVGLGALGSAAAWRLAERGLRVVGFDLHHPPHALGSTHGAGRVIREGFFEAPFYVPLVRRAYEGWAHLERISGTGLLRTTGALMAGDPEGTLVRGTLEAVRAHGIGHRVLDATRMRGGPAPETPPGAAPEIPSGLAPEPHMSGVLEERAGVLHPERCVAAALSEARRLGADLRFGTPVVAWEVEGDEVIVRTGGGGSRYGGGSGEKGGSGSEGRGGEGGGPGGIEGDGGDRTVAQAEIRAGALVLAAGPWMSALIGLGNGSPLPLEVVRQVTHRFEQAPEPDRQGTDGAGEAARPHAGHGLVTIWEYAPDRFFYTVPEEGAVPGRRTLKVAIHYGGDPVDPETVDRSVTPEEVEEARGLVDRFLPGAAGAHLDSAVCLYTNTPDHHFVLGHDPRWPQVVLAGGGSGHAFKFAPALGELVADLVLGEEPFMDLAPFRPERFGGVEA